MADALDLETPETSLIVREFRKYVAESLRMLNARERDILERSIGMHGPPVAMTEIGRQQGVTGKRIWQIKRRALGKLMQPNSPLMLYLNDRPVISSRTSNGAH